jgi:hypothetical protein
MNRCNYSTNDSRLNARYSTTDYQRDARTDYSRNDASPNAGTNYRAQKK